MSEPSEQAKRKACELANQHCGTRHITPYAADDGSPALVAFARHIQNTSDVAKFAENALFQAGVHRTALSRTRLRSLILPDEPDPLDKFAEWLNGCSKDGKKLQEAAAMFGLKIVEAGDD